jgi:hypothetical protein
VRTKGAPVSVGVSLGRSVRAPIADRVGSHRSGGGFRGIRERRGLSF